MIKVDYLYCPDSEKCPFYEKWKTNINEGLEVITKDEKKYTCIALHAVIYAPVKEGGILLEHLFKSRLPENGIIECEKIKTLNLLEGILNKK